MAVATLRTDYEGSRQERVRFLLDGDVIGVARIAFCSDHEYGFYPADPDEERFDSDALYKQHLWEIITAVAKGCGACYVECSGRVSLDWTGECVGFIVVNANGTYAKAQLGKHYEKASPFHATVWYSREDAEAHAATFGGTVKRKADVPKLLAHEQTLREQREQATC